MAGRLYTVRAIIEHWVINRDWWQDPGDPRSEPASPSWNSGGSRRPRAPACRRPSTSCAGTSLPRLDPAAGPGLSALAHPRPGLERVSHAAAGPGSSAHAAAGPGSSVTPRPPPRAGRQAQAGRLHVTRRLLGPPRPGHIRAPRPGRRPRRLRPAASPPRPPAQTRPTVFPNGFTLPPYAEPGSQAPVHLPLPPPLAPQSQRQRVTRGRWGNKGPIDEPWGTQDPKGGRARRMGLVACPAA